MWLKLFFLLLYFFLLFVLARFFEAIVWYETGILATQLVDPVALSFKKLKTILECRGLGYSGLPEKKDVRELVERSGTLMQGELYSALKNEEEDAEPASSTSFSGEVHFYELVEDTKDGIWLVQVIAKDREPLLTKANWGKMVQKVSKFGIRTGTFNCSSDPRYCRKRGWLKSTLIMSVPQTSTSKGKVMLKEYNGSRIETEHIFKWMTALVASRIKTIRVPQQLLQEWNRSDQHPVKMFLFAKLVQPPAFFSALSVKFTGRIEFIFVDVQDWDSDRCMEDIGVRQVPSYILKTPEGTYRYGNSTGEYISLHAMDTFLRSVQPEVNDLFVLSLVMINLMAWMDLFITQGATIKRFVVLISTLGTYNSLLIISWLPILGFLQLPYLDSFYEYSLKLLRYADTTTIASWVRADWTFYSSHPALFLSTYLGHGLLVDYFEKKKRRSSNNDDELNANNLEWLSSLWDWYTSYLIHPIASFHNFPNESDWDDDPDLLLQRLAFPDLWLRPLVPTDYIKNLPTWKLGSAGRFSGRWSSKATGEEDGGGTASGELQNKPVSTQEDLTDGDHLGTGTGDASGSACEGPGCSFGRGGRCHSICSEAPVREADWSSWPPDMMQCTECVVCLENFEDGCLLMGLPCSHVFHQQCIVVWLAGGRHCCPVCRWPSFKKKADREGHAMHGREQY